MQLLVCTIMRAHELNHIIITQGYFTLKPHEFNAALIS